MEQWTYSQIRDKLLVHGRTQETEEGLSFNWTCAGVTVSFTGKVLQVRLRVEDGCPWIAAADETGRLFYRQSCQTSGDWYTLWRASVPGRYTVRLVRLTENTQGRLTLLAVACDGALHYPIAPRLRIEFVGDSITCGYGNEANSPLEHFLPRHENGWQTACAQAARTLCADWSCVAVSGITVSAGKYKNTYHARTVSMEQLYCYTDLPTDRARQRAPDVWRFSAHPVDAVVVNLGTNDEDMLIAAQSRQQMQAERAFFRQRYRALLKQIRRYNGPLPWIVCTLGPLRYALWDDILCAADEYHCRTGDTRVLCRKLSPLEPEKEGLGGDGHPTLFTHTRMGRELAAILAPLLQQQISASDV
ncbi:MAG TPA: hypothetical protein IAD07_00980 [Candidatus Fimivicinus intestinavium]|nr:hypothetical protein [Candidatus Fimivicinus intestinavium]